MTLRCTHDLSAAVRIRKARDGENVHVMRNFIIIMTDRRDG